MVYVIDMMEIDSLKIEITKIGQQFPLNSVISVLGSVTSRDLCIWESPFIFEA